MFIEKAPAQLFDRLNEGVPIRSYVSYLGNMQDRPLQDLIDSFRSQKYDEIKMTYAIYYWITRNIVFDTKAFHHPNKNNITASSALKTRKTTAEGYTAVFKTLCDVAGIKCYTVKGYVKTDPLDIGITDKLTEHAWNIVRIKNILLFIDPTLGAGNIDHKRKNFTPEYHDGWFLTNKDLFFLDHYSNDKSNPISAKQAPDKATFKTSPVVYNDAIVMNIFPSATVKGKLRGREGKTKTIDLEINNNDLQIRTASIVANGTEIPIEVKGYDNILVLDIPFNKAGDYPIILKLNDKNVFGFLAHVTKVKKH